MITFEYTFFVLLFPFLIGIWYFLDFKKLWKKFPNPIIAKYCNNPFEKKFLWFLRIIIIVCFIWILSKWMFHWEIKKQIPEPQNIFIVVDISKSMLAEDILPNRMSIAKKVIADFVFERKNDNIGLIIFAGKPFTMIANSSDSSGIMHFIENITPDFIAQDKAWLSGTNIGDALLLAEYELSQLHWEKNIILITDGSANIGSNPLDTTKILQEKNIKTFTIGIGKKDNLPLFYTDINGQKNYFYDSNGEKIIADLDDELLKKIANNTNAKYFDAENISEFQNVLSETNANIGNKKIEKKILQKVALTPFFLIIIVIAIICENFYRKKFYKKFNLL